MKIGRLEIGLSANKDIGAPPTTEDRASSKVDEYYGVTSKSFPTYKTIVGDTSITYDVLEGIYHKTIMNKVINKLAGDATRIGFTKVNCVDIKDQPVEKGELVSAEITRLLSRRVLRGIYRDMMLYGDAFLYKNEGIPANGTISVDDVYGINPRYINPDVKNSQLAGWKYGSTKGEEVDLSLEEVVHIPNSPLTGQLFGNSIMEPVLQVLNLVLNSQLNSAIILDKFALPIVHWQLDSKHDTKKTPLSEILKFIANMGKMSTGSDFVSDSSVKSDVIGGKQSMIDFSPMLNKLDDYLFATTGVPAALLGFKGDNLSATTRQLQTYYDNIFDMQENAADHLISGLYWPEIANQKLNTISRVYFSYPKPMVEQESRIATWVKTMGEAGLIYKKEGRAALGYPGEPPEEPEIVPPPTMFGGGGFPQQQPEESTPNIDKKSGNPKPPIGKS